jgi:hypothetical protein
MKKTIIILRNLAIIAAVIAAIMYLSNHTFEAQMIIGIYALVLYIAYLGNERVAKLSKDKIYHCTFEKAIIAADSDRVITYFQIKYKLPFPPYIGLEVTGNLNPMPADCEDYKSHDSQSFYTGKITSVVLSYSDLYGSTFSCKVEPYKMEVDATPEQVMDVIIAHSEDAWRISDSLFLIHGGKDLFSYIDNALFKLKELDDETSKNHHMRLERVKKKLAGC